MSPTGNQAPSPSYWSQIKFLLPLISLQLPGCVSQTQSHLDLIFPPLSALRWRKKHNKGVKGCHNSLILRGHRLWFSHVLQWLSGSLQCEQSICRVCLKRSFQALEGGENYLVGVMSCQQVSASQAYGKGKRVLKKVQSPRKSRRNVRHVIGKSWACQEQVKWKVVMKGKKK